jgi:hypothetical protein
MRESQRLYALTSAKFEDALHFAFNDPFILKGYAHCLCAYLRAEAVSGLNKFGASGAKLKIRDAIVKFREINLPEGIGEIVLQLPKDPQYGDLVSFGFLTMKGLDHLYFSRGESLKRSDMTWLPQVFGLDHPRSPADYIAAAAGMYQEVCKDFNLHFVYADVDLQWLYRLTSPELVLGNNEPFHHRLLYLSYITQHTNYHSSLSFPSTSLFKYFPFPRLPSPPP